MAKPSRPEVPEEWVSRADRILSAFPECEEDPAWTGVRWRVRGATVAHLFGGHDQRFRITFRASPDELAAFHNLGEPYFVVGEDAVGMIVDDTTDWEEVAELLLDSYCVQAPASLAQLADPTYVRD